MLVKVVGKKNLNFKTEDGKSIDGAHFFVTYEEEGIEGLAAEKFFISSSKLNPMVVSIGDSLNIYFNRFGKVDKVENAEDLDI